MCSDIDKCDADHKNDIDSDHVGGDGDSCPYNAMVDYGSDGFCENYDSGPYDPNNNDQDNDGWGLIDCCRDDLSFRLPGTIHADGCASFGPRQINERCCLKDCGCSICSGTSAREYDQYSDKLT